MPLKTEGGLRPAHRPPTTKQTTIEESAYIFNTRVNYGRPDRQY